MSKVNSLIMLKDENVVSTSEQLQASQAQAKVSKVNPAKLLKDAIAVGASGSEQSKLCIFIEYVSTIGTR